VLLGAAFGRHSLSQAAHVLLAKGSCAPTPLVPADSLVNTSLDAIARFGTRSPAINDGVQRSDDRHTQVIAIAVAE